MLDLGGTLGRRFGGIGPAVLAPSLHLAATLADTFTAEGSPAAVERALVFARRYAELGVNRIVVAPRARDSGEFVRAIDEAARQLIGQV